MVNAFWYFVMVPMVYIAVVWCLVGIVVRIVQVVREPSPPHTLRIFRDDEGPDAPSGAGLGPAIWDALTMPSVRRYQPVFWVFLMVFHVSLVILVPAHLDILPQINVLSAESPHMLGNGAIGVLFTVSLAYFLLRRFKGPVREVSVASDYLLLVLLLSIAITGDVISWGNLWTEQGFVITKQEFGQYMTSLLNLSFADPLKFLPGTHYVVIGTHILLVNLLLMFLPFSNLMHTCFAVPLNVLRRG
ncbi:MAG: respiratory nitrate reductase subunit gamma [Thermodesulfobacteriota bacterium]